MNINDSTKMLAETRTKFKFSLGWSAKQHLATNTKLKYKPHDICDY